MSEMSMNKNICQLNIPGLATQREWAVYIIVAEHAPTANQYLYVGKVGDNREGCNPIISRVGNHLSLGRTHSQLRNKLEKKGHATSDCSYTVYFATFGAYKLESQSTDRERINELERRLNHIVQDELVAQQAKYELLNPLNGTYPYSKVERERRARLLQEHEVAVLKELAAQALGMN